MIRIVWKMKGLGLPMINTYRKPPPKTNPQRDNVINVETERKMERDAHIKQLDKTRK